MSKQVGVDLSGSAGEMFDVMVVVDPGMDPRPIIDAAVKEVEKQREEWLKGSDFIDRGAVVSGEKFNTLAIKDGLAVEMIIDHRDNKLYARAITKVDKA